MSKHHFIQLLILDFLLNDELQKLLHILLMNGSATKFVILLEKLVDVLLGFACHFLLLLAQENYAKLAHFGFSTTNTKVPYHFALKYLDVAAKYINEITTFNKLCECETWTAAVTRLDRYCRLRKLVLEPLFLIVLFYTRIPLFHKLRIGARKGAPSHTWVINIPPRSSEVAWQSPSL